MQSTDPSSSIGQVVKDVYGRELGRCIGYSVDLAGNLSTIGVETGPSFVEFPADCIVSTQQDVILMPEWKLNSRRLGLEKGILDKRLTALDQMLKQGEISRRTYDDMVHGLQNVRFNHERLGEMLVKRLQELEAMDDRISAFLVSVKLQGVSEEISDTAVKWTSDYCLAMKAMNEKERVDITNALDLVGKEPIAQTEDNPAILEQGEAVPAESEHVAEAEATADTAPETEPVVTQGGLRSLGSNGQ